MYKEILVVIGVFIILFTILLMQYRKSVKELKEPLYHFEVTFFYRNGTHKIVHVDSVEALKVYYNEFTNKHILWSKVKYVMKNPIIYI